ncbi:Rha family transcriptional regulator [Aeromonas diversa]|uniref:Rha family phage regulatory protein n=1 Tax=Aeromonas diversa TaxID=502790 RepID=UPI0039A26B45
MGQAWDQADLDDINTWSKLTVLANESYSVGAAAKSAAGICTPILHKELTHAPIAWFFVSVRPPLFGVLLAYPAIGILSVMVARAGQPSGWPVSSMCAGSANPARATAMRFAPLCGSNNLLHMEAAIMATVPTPLAPVVQVIDGKAVTTSLDLAHYFGKRHDDVIRKIRTLDCSPDFRLRNFTETVYDRPNPAGGAPIPTPCYLLTRDGFFFVAMGFTGARAAQFKEAYIAAFNRMEQQQTLPLEQYMAKLDDDYLLDTMRHTLAFWETVNGPWRDVLYPMLVALRSPLAGLQVDRYTEMTLLLHSLAGQMGVRVAPRQPAEMVANEGGKRHG